MPIHHLILFLFSIALSSKLVEYKFGTYFGQIIYDSSGQGNHGQNGESILSVLYDTRGHDRGAYFRTSAPTFIKLPPNEAVSTSLSLGSIFSLAIWLYIYDTNNFYLTYRILDSSNYFYLERDTSIDKLRVRIVRTGYDSSIVVGTHTFTSSIWNMVAMINQGQTSEFYLNGALDITITQPSSYAESGSYMHYIGYTTSAIQGFVWSFHVFNEVATLSELYTSSHTVGNCLIADCPTSCSPAIVENGVSYCLSIVYTGYFNGKGIACLSNSFGCSITTQLDCSTCATGGCKITSTPVICMCNDGTESGGACTCASGKYFSYAAIGCANCYEECLTCSAANTCLTCKDSHSTKHATIGCTCNSGYYNTTTLVSDGKCLVCYEECLTCSAANVCLTCKDSHSTKHATIGCACQSGYYNTTALINEGTCLACDASTSNIDACTACNSDCSSCGVNNLCIECKDINASPILTLGCECNTKFYNMTSLLNGGECLPCDPDCLSCKVSMKCETCIDLNSDPHDNIGCTCRAGYYNTTRLNINGACIKCGQYCSVCENNENCLECTHNKMNIQGGTCDCPINSSLKIDTCVANEGYYIEQNSSGYYTDKCHSSCKSCTGPEDTECEICADELVKSGSLCVSCEPGKYFESNFCLECSDECLTCKDYSYCLSCKDSSKTPVSGTCLLQCDIGYFNRNGECEQCPVLCSVCTNTSYCSECKNSSFLFNNICGCSVGYKEAQSMCVKQYFKANLSVSSKNIVSIVFNESVSVSLKAENFSFQIDNQSDFELSLLKNKFNKELLFGLVFKNSVKAGTKIYGEILIEDLRSKTGAFLKNNRLSGELSEFTFLNPYKNDALLEASLTSSKSSVTVAVSSSLFSALISDPSAAWALLNTIQLLNYIPINSLPLTDTLKIFLSDKAKYNIIPNFYAKHYPQNTSGRPYLEARRYGIQTSVLIQSIGPSLILFLCITSLWPFAFLLSKFSSGKFAAKIIKLLGNYKFSFFLRFWTQMYLEIGIYAVIQLKATVNHWLGYMNQGISTVCLIGIVLTPLLVAIAGYFSSVKIKEGNREFIKKWGSLYMEFKNDKGFWSSQYYFFYFSRRLAYLIAQVYLNQFLLVQGGIHICFCSLLIGFLLIYRPFKSRAILISNLISEIGICIVITLSYGFLFDIKVDFKEILERIIIFTTLITLFLQFSITIFVFFKALANLWRKYNEKRCLEIASKAEKELSNFPK